MPNIPNQPYFPASASREELDIELNVLEGKLPEDWHGFVYLNSSVGTPNSGGLPFQTQRPDGSTNPEYGSPLLGGDSMVYCYNLSEKGKLKLKSRLLKPPCYYADQATQFWQDGKQNPLFKLYGFRNLGMTRLSYMLGMRNELCTAVTPFQFKKDAAPRILANFDAGRPYEFDAQTLAIKTPIGANTEWTSSTPPFLVFPFPIFQSTAHPSFDPITQELFSVNFVKSFKVMANQLKVLQLLRHSPEELEKKLEEKIKTLQDRRTDLDSLEGKKEMIGEINDFFQNVEKHVEVKESWWHRLLMLIRNAIKSSIEEKTSLEDAVYLMRWRGEGAWDKWQLIDSKTQQPMVIQQCMHQMGISKDFVVLIDAGFKLTFDMMFNNPFPNNPIIDSFFRLITTATMLDYTDTYIVDRRTLEPQKKTVQVRKLPFPLPYETIHFSVNYDNPNDTITIHCAHNSAACLAEWVRSYDYNELTGKPSSPKVLGLPPTGITDISRIGRYQINGKTGRILEQNVVADLGNTHNLANVGANTWGIALYTHRDIVSANQVTRRIKNIFWQCYGLEKDLLTRFVYNLYKNYPNRQVDLNDIRRYTEAGIPFVISRMNMETMQFEDAHIFDPTTTFRAIQFVPRQTPRPNTDESIDGYIFCAVTKGLPDPQEPTNPDKMTYQSQIWIFDAADLSKPICKLAHEKLIANTTLHSAWLEKAQSLKTDYNIDVRGDYNPLIKNALLGNFLGGILFRKQRQQIQAIFDQYVYPHFY